MLLLCFKSLPQLFSLDTKLFDKATYDFGNIYRMTVSLPVLKYNHLIFAINERFRTIEYLNVDHNCTARQLFSVLRHTPQLRCLTCRNLIGSDISNEQLVTLSNLKSLSIDCGFVTPANNFSARSIKYST